MEPREIGLAGGFDPQNQELGCLVGVQLVQPGFKGGKLLRAGLEQQQGFRGALDLALPAVDGLDSRDKRSAGNQPAPRPACGPAARPRRGQRRW